ncbi:conserved hypothetical protein [Paraburkholderia unamae]|uniref:hypothetical protein n=1 Tax=Paraburkholderia unamae TaxID=219649 RepID=UPI001CB575DC|nr:hypothetical protein [Paraburkholderia unamae]CAG9268301.1 conserved hypothetical protein [Paraburkholderia unamae]
MAVQELQNPKLQHTIQQAGEYLDLAVNRRVTSAWCRYLRDDRDTRGFFNEDPMRKSDMFTEQVAARAAEAYLSCGGGGYEHAVPNSQQIKSIRVAAASLEAQLEASARWIIPGAKAPGFREPLRELGASPSAIPPRAAGRPGLILRRAFVLRLAESLYDLTSTFPVKVLTVATALGWEDTGERQIRDILSTDTRVAIAERARARRAAEISSENATRHLLARVAVDRDSTGPKEEQSDPQKLTEILRLLGSFSDRTASTVMIDELTRLADEFGIEAADRPAGHGGN